METQNLSKTLKDPTETVVRRANDLLRQLEKDKSIRKFDQVLRAEQVAPRTRLVYFQQIHRLKRHLPIEVTTDLDELPVDLLLDSLGKIADKAKGTGYILTAATLKHFYKSIGRKDIAEKIPKPRARSKVANLAKIPHNWLPYGPVFGRSHTHIEPTIRIIRLGYHKHTIESRDEDARYVGL